MKSISNTIEQHWQKPNFMLSILLFLPSILWSVIAQVRRRLYQIGILKQTHVNVPVIVLGNLHAGGVGKTPITIALVQSLRQKGIIVGVVSRGYGRESRENLIVNPNGDARNFGDEPLLIAQKTAAPVAVAARRAEGALLLLQKFPQIQLIVCDDGLQHYALARDMECVIFPFSDLHRAKQLKILPNGALREPLSRLKTIDTLLISHCPTDFIPQRLSVECTQFAVYNHFGDCYALNHPQKTVTGNFFKGRKTAAFTAIAKPERFFDTLNQLDIFPEITDFLPDHAPLTPQRLPVADCVIITEKDATKLAQYDLPQVWVLPLCAIIPPLFVQSVIRYVHRN